MENNEDILLEETPVESAQDKFNKALSTMFRLGVECGWAESDPTMAYKTALAEVKAIFSKEEMPGMWRCTFGSEHESMQQCDCDHE